MSKEQLAECIALGMLKQNAAIEFDNLGDGESIIFLHCPPVINLANLAEHILKEMGK